MVGKESNQKLNFFSISFRSGKKLRLLGSQKKSESSLPNKLITKP